MNFVIFPMYFASPALYPLWRVQESSPLLFRICQANPFTYVVELIRFAFYGQIEWLSLGVVVGFTVIFLTGAIIAYDPSRGLMTRKQDGGRKRMMRADGICAACAALSLRRPCPPIAGPRHRPRLALHPAQGAGTVAGADLERPRAAGIRHGLAKDKDVAELVTEAGAAPHPDRRGAAGNPRLRRAASSRTRRASGWPCWRRGCSTT